MATSVLEPVTRERAAGAVDFAATLAQSLLLALVFAIPSLISLHSAAVRDSDIWWHLRTGEWVALHRAVPHNDSFSTSSMGRPWVAYSWLFELGLFGLFRHFGTAGIVIFTSAMLLLITVALHHLAARLARNFTYGVCLTIVGCFSMVSLASPRPWLVSIPFFIFVLDIVVHARCTGGVRELFWLPVIFAMWANVHIQFVDGLVVLALASAEALLSRRLQLETRLRPVWVVGVTLASVLATFCNPYGWHLYQAAYTLASQTGVMNKVQEMQAIPFRRLSDWFVLGLVFAAAIALARSRRQVFFEAALLVFAVVVGFRSQRDVWITVLVAVAIVAGRSADMARTNSPERRWWLRPVAAVCAAVAILCGFRALPVKDDNLFTQISAVLPVQAVSFLKAHPHAGPVFNDYAWGGYLIWALRLPVSIDGRAGLHGDEQIARSDATWAGASDWKSDPWLQSAGVVVGPAQAALTQLLRDDRDFRLVYSDAVASVFVREP